MNRRTFVLAAGASGLAGGAWAAPAIGPEYRDVFAGLGPGNTLIDLERQVPKAKTRLKGLGFGGADAYYELTGAASPVRFKAGAVPPLVVRVASQEEDPMGIIQFFKLQVVKNTRRLVAVRVNAMGVGGGTTGNEFSVPFTARKHGSSFFLVKPQGALAPGEYGISLTTAAAGYLFGVD
ncbi:MAG: hypothetical protein JWR84_699 [Caulobacter sp.]|nr:hypothetical protein [Caulobacter sp.]